MPPTTQDITGYVLGDNLDITRTVTDVPASQTLSDAWLTIKRRSSDEDADAALQKHITPSYVAGQGHITDTGADTTGALLFELVPGDAATLSPSYSYFYDIQVKTNAGVTATPFRGRIRFEPGITDAL